MPAITLPAVSPLHGGCASSPRVPAERDAPRPTRKRKLHVQPRQRVSCRGGAQPLRARAPVANAVQCAAAARVLRFSPSAVPCRGVIMRMIPGFCASQRQRSSRPSPRLCPAPPRL